MSDNIDYATFGYSTTEQRVGTWIDGKPLYRKTLPITTPSAGASTVQYGETLGNVVKFEPHFLSSSGYSLGQCYYEAGAMVFCVIAGPSSAYFSVLAASYRGMAGYITVYYTKTTD